MSLEVAQFIVAVLRAVRAGRRRVRACCSCRAPSSRMDPRVAGAPWTLRLLILPGVAALWPLFAWRWIAGAPEPIERNPHRAKAGAR